jgi:hypothetical protein
VIPAASLFSAAYYFMEQLGFRTGQLSTPVKDLSGGQRRRLQLLLVLLEAVYSTTDPPIKAVRRVVPTFRIGSIALDLGFILVLVIAYVLRYVNSATLLQA